MIKRFKTYIEQEPWDEIDAQSERLLNRFCLAVVLLAVLYFTPICINAFRHGGNHETSISKTETENQLPVNQAMYQTGSVHRSAER